MVGPTSPLYLCDMKEIKASVCSLGRWVQPLHLMLLQNRQCNIQRLGTSSIWRSVGYDLAVILRVSGKTYGAQRGSSSGDRVCGEGIDSRAQTTAIGGRIHSKQMQ